MSSWLGSALNRSDSSDCMPTIIELSLHSAVTKSWNALSSRFFDASNSRCTECCRLSASPSARRGCLPACCCGDESWFGCVAELAETERPGVDGPPTIMLLRFDGPEGLEPFVVRT